MSYRSEQEYDRTGSLYPPLNINYDSYPDILPGNSVECTCFDEKGVKIEENSCSIHENNETSLESIDLEAIENLPKEFDGQTERTLLLIKPGSVDHEIKIEARLRKEGFYFIQKRKVHLSYEQVSEFYSEHYGQLWYPRLCLYMSSGPVKALCLTKRNAIYDLRMLLGPTDVREARMFFPSTMRAKFGSVRDELKNALHASDSTEKAEFEIHFFFPNMVLEPLWTGDAMWDYVCENLRLKMVDGLAEVCKVKPVDPVLWFAHWLLINNANKPTQEPNIAALQT